MNKKISEITINDIADYIRLTEISESDKKQLSTSLGVAKSFIKGYTGLTEEEIDKYNEFVIVIYVLCQDMYDNRSLYVDETNINYTVKTILDMYSTKLLG